jgi:hypothetical protein
MEYAPLEKRPDQPETNTRTDAGRFVGDTFVPAAEPEYGSVWPYMPDMHVGSGMGRSEMEAMFWQAHFGRGSGNPLLDALNPFASPLGETENGGTSGHAEPSTSSTISRAPAVQPSTAEEGFPLNEAQAEKVDTALAETGQPLPEEQKAVYEAHTGHDFSRVRVHTGAAAEEAADSIGAKAFAKGSDIVFAKDQYNPGTAEGRGLIGHELAHVAQNATGVHRAPKKDEKQNKPLPDYRRHANYVLNRLEGYTSDLDSKEIIEYLEKLNTVELTGTLEAISMSSLEGRNNPDKMIAWLFEDLQSPDRKRLTQLMLERGLTRFLFEHIAYQIIQSKDEDEIVTMLSSYYGNLLDDILTRFEKKSGTGERQAVLALSGKLDQTPVYRLRRHFYQNGGNKARRYGALITAEKIMELLKGSTSSADRFSIVDNFLVTPSSLKNDVIGFVSEKTQQEWHKPAWLVLNEKLMPAHYNALRIMGLILPEYDRKKSNVSLLENTIDAFFTVTGVIIGAVIGVARGTLESFFELIIGLVDIAVLIKDFAMAALHYVTLGAVGRESHEKIVELFTGIVYAVNNPREVIKGVWDNLKVESDAIEGPHEYARRVYFWSKVVTKFTIGVVAIFGGIRALAAKLKTLKRGAKEVATVAEVAEEAAVTAERTRIPREPLPEPKKPVKGEKPPEPAKRPPGKGVDEGAGALENVGQLSRSYAEMTGKLDKGFQANHLNQDAAYRQVIPSDKGAAVAMRGNAFTDIGTPHYEFHRSLELFWQQYRKGGALFGKTPTNGEYGRALRDALSKAGFDPKTVGQLVKEAAANRAAYGIRENDPVPRIPSRLPQKVE